MQQKNTFRHGFLASLNLQLACLQVAEAKRIGNPRHIGLALGHLWAAIHECEDGGVGTLLIRTFLEGTPARDSVTIRDMRCA